MIFNFGIILILLQVKDPYIFISHSYNQRTYIDIFTTRDNEHIATLTVSTFYISNIYANDKYVVANSSTKHYIFSLENSELVTKISLYIFIFLPLLIFLSKAHYGVPFLALYDSTMIRVFRNSSAVVSEALDLVTKKYLWKSEVV